MKKLMAIVLLCSTVFASCKKVNERFPDAFGDPQKLIVANVWQIQKIKSSQSNILYNYERGGQNNNYNYDGDYLKFNADGTGTYSAGVQYQITWQFTNAEKSELTYTIKDYANGQPAIGSSMDVNLENVRLTTSTFRYAEIYTNANGASAVSSVYRVPYVMVK